MLAGCECEVKRQKYSAAVKRIGKIFQKKRGKSGKIQGNSDSKFKSEYFDSKRRQLLMTSLEGSPF